MVEKTWNTIGPIAERVARGVERLRKRKAIEMEQATIKVFTAEEVAAIAEDKDRVPSANDSWVRYEDHTTALADAKRQQQTEAEWHTTVPLFRS